MLQWSWHWQFFWGKEVKGFMALCQVLCLQLYKVRALIL